MFKVFTHRLINKAMTDKQMLERYLLSKNIEILAELFLRHSEAIFLVCVRYLTEPAWAEDTTMEIYESLPKKIETQTIENFKSWLYVVSKNECLMRLRSKALKDKKMQELKNTLESSMESEQIGHHCDEDTDLSNILPECLDALNLNQRRCVEMFYLESKSYDEIQKNTEMTYNQVKSNIQNGKKRLKKLLLEKTKTAHGNEDNLSR